MAVRAVRVLVHGHVQGVFFRASTRRVATRWGVRGWVRNLRDGSVEAWLEGEEVDVDAVLDWIRGGGPGGARVDAVEVDVGSPTRATGFTITR